MKILIKRIFFYLFCTFTLMIVIVACEPREVLSDVNSKTYRMSDFDPPQNLDGEEALYQLLGLTLDDLDIWRDHVGRRGLRARKFYQMVEGRELYGANVLLVTDEKGQFVRLSGRSPGDTRDFKIIEASLSQKDAISAAIRGVYGSRIKESSFVISPTSKMVTYQSAPLYRLIFDRQGETSKTLRQAYVVSLNGSPNGKDVPNAIRNDLIDILVDGKSGNIVDVINLVSD